MTDLKLLFQAPAGAGAAQLFFNELLEHNETLAGIADQHGVRTLADVIYLQNAILDGSFIELFPDESAILTVVEALPSAAIWRGFIKLDGDDVPVPPVRLRSDTPDEVLEMLLFNGAPTGRSREELEARFAAGAHVPYLVRWLGDYTIEKLEQAQALGFPSVAAMEEHAAHLRRHQAAFAEAKAYQNSPEADARKEAAAKQFGISPDQIVWVDPREPAVQA